MASEQLELRVITRRRYEIVAALLEKSVCYKSVQVLSEELGWKKFQVRTSVPRARKLLASKGIIIVNKLGHGYKIGDLEEFTKEVDKSCKRAVSQIKSMVQTIELLHCAKIEGLEGLFALMKKNADSIRVLFTEADIEDFDSYEEMQDAIDDDKITPDFLDEIPNEIVIDTSSSPQAEG
jgi:predicted transcriptional regulator